MHLEDYRYSHDARNQITSAAEQGAFSYDANGNFLYSGSSAVHGYDDANQLTQVLTVLSGDWRRGGEPAPGEGWRTDLLSDGLGRLRVRSEYYSEWDGEEWIWYLNTQTSYVYDGMRVIQERDLAGDPAVSYTRGTDLSGTLEGAGGIGGLLARSHGYWNGNWTAHNYYFADGNGNITALVDGSQALSASYGYAPFGDLLWSSGALAGENTYRFSSKEYHAGSDLYYFGYRWYSPNLQRWVNRDPIGERGGINLYGFVENDPLNSIDPFGLDGTNDPLKGVGKVVDDAKKVAGVCKKVCEPVSKAGIGQTARAASGAATRVIDTVAKGAEAGVGLTSIAWVREACRKYDNCVIDPCKNEADCAQLKAECDRRRNILDAINRKDRK